ncbi:MAG: protein kinase, partial [Gemmatimonadetes bacterium]|nr:protein kinase [Gemmatimonadota bacterium]
LEREGQEQARAAREKEKAAAAAAEQAELQRMARDIWSVYIAFKYAKLWCDGYDWRDVFRQPRDREVMEVIEEVADHVRALFDPRIRERLRGEREQRKALARSAPNRLPSGFAASPSGVPYQGIPPAAMAALSGPMSDRVRQALSDRDEIFRRLGSLGGSLPKVQRDEVTRSAMTLAERVQGFAVMLDELTRQDASGAREQLESEITALESAANPLERGSEDRVRRLAYLKRQRRALADTTARKETVAAKLETCALALQNMRFDLMRLGASPEMHQHITSLANQAISLADDVDDAMHVADEMGRLGSRRPTPGARRTTGRG